MTLRTFFLSRKKRNGFFLNFFVLFHAFYVQLGLPA